MIDRTPKPCHHKQADHRHGTNATYVLDKCRCEPCAAAHAAQERWRTRQKAYGRYDKYVDANEARQHVRSLMAQGMGLKRIVAASDVSQGLLWKLVYGKRRPDGTRTPSKRILRTTHDRILAIQPDLALGAKIDSTGTVRRIQALVALGWSQSKIARRIGIAPSNFTPLAQGHRDVTVATAKAVQRLYDELSMTLPPQDTQRDRIAASRARNHAKRHGWLPPLAWDDALIDDPTHASVIERDRGLTHDTELDEAAIWRRMHGDKTVRVSKAEAAEIVARCRAQGWPWNEIERHTGLNPQRYERREDMPA